jgi:hypothetical protein
MVDLMADNDSDFVRYVRNGVRAQQELLEETEHLERNLDDHVEQAYEFINHHSPNGAGVAKGTIQQAIALLCTKCGGAAEDIESDDVMAAMAVAGQMKDANR